MKSKSLIMGMVSLAALSLTACNNEKALDIPADNVGAYMTLQLVGPESNITTKTTPGADGTEEGTAVQNKISNLKIFLCDPTDHKVKTSYDVPEGKLDVVPGGVKTKQILTTTGTFDVYVIANPPASFTVADGSVLTDQTINDVTEALMKSDYAADNKFMMFNECNGTDKVAGSSITITAANDYENPATCSPIYLDRLAVQVRSAAASTMDISDITAEYPFLTASELQSFKLLNAATKSNLQQKWSNTVAAMGTTYPWDNLLQTPSLNEGTNTGSDSQYYNHLTDFRSVSIATGGVYTVVKDTYDSVTPYESTGKGSIFCMENHPASALMGNTTGLVYQFKAAVTGSDNKAGTGCFYGYSDKYFASLAALQAAYPHVFDAASASDVASDDLAAAETELATAYAASDKQTEISNFRVKYNVKVYAEGLMYYTYFIKDNNYQNSTLTGTDKRYYSVMRNTIYDLTIKKLARIGTDIPGGWTPDVDEPTDPVDPINVYMVVEAQVNKWVLSKEEITLD